ncbi:MAG: hypothetical protein IJ986_05285 [Bacteroidales bacterium]|nr:hypothetical protein [Bacteroidales bacterium]
MSKIRIGADELILWLRKNGKEVNTPNDEIHGLGVKIRRTIEQLGGNIVEENHECYWANKDGDKNIGQYQLPKTAAQYEISIEKLTELYTQLNCME